MFRPYLKSTGFSLMAAAVLAVTGCKKDKGNDGSSDPQAPGLASNVTAVATGTGELEQIIKLTANVKWTVNIPSENATWLSVDKSSGEKNSDIKLTIRANTENDARSGKVVLKGEGVTDVTVTVNQKGLIDWQKAIPNNSNVRVFEVEDGYVLAGERNQQMYIYKVNKTTMDLIKAEPIEITGYPRSSFIDLEPLPGGGFIGTGLLNQLTSGTATDVYVFELDNNLNRVKGKVIDFGTTMDVPYGIHKLNAGYVLAFYKGGSTFLTRLNENLDEVDGSRKITSMGTMRDVKVTSDNEVIVTGHADNQFTVAKFRNDLTLRTMTRMPFNGIAEAAWISADNKVIVTGEKNVTDGYDIYAARFDANLSETPEKEFSIHKGQYDYATSIIGLTGGGYALSGLVTIDGNSMGYAVKFDNNFNSAPLKEVFIPYLMGAGASLAQSDGGFLVTGTGRNPSTNWSNLVKLNP